MNKSMKRIRYTKLWIAFIIAAKIILTLSSAYAGNDDLLRVQEEQLRVQQQQLYVQDKMAREQRDANTDQYIKDFQKGIDADEAKLYGGHK